MKISAPHPRESPTKRPLVALFAFHPLPAPDRTDLQDITSDVAIRTLAWLRRRDLLRDELDQTDSTEQRDRSALSACLEGSLGLGELTALRERNQAEGHATDALPVPAKATRRGGTDRGFDLHAGAVVSAADREGRERLLRYCARSPLSLERLRLLPDGRVAYALRKPWGKQTHRVIVAEPWFPKKFKQPARELIADGLLVGAVGIRRRGEVRAVPFSASDEPWRGIVRSLYRAERGHTPAGADRLRELELIGLELRAALKLAHDVPDPDTLGHRAAWDRAERATQRLYEFVDDVQPLRPAVLATANSVRSKRQTRR